MALRYFGTDGIRGEVGNSIIQPDFILKLGWAIGKVLGEDKRSRVLIGKDTRVSGYLLESALESGLSASGTDIFLLGPMPTPGIAYLTRTLRADAGIVISASHNPFYDNGIKLISQTGGKLSSQLEHKIEAYLDKPIQVVRNKVLGKAVRVDSAAFRYIEYCKSKLSSKCNLNDFKLVIDCANGATYHIAPYVFEELGAEVICINDKPDGFNINKNSGSTNPDNLVEVVKSTGADCGIAFDGDGDRLIMVDREGSVLDGDSLLYILAKHAQFRGGVDGVVGTIMSNLGVEQAFKSANIPFYRANVGDKYVLSALKDKNWRLGGEPSGHLIDLDKMSTGDGIIIALLVLNAVKDTGIDLLDWHKCLVKYPQKIFNIPNSAMQAAQAWKTLVGAIEHQVKERGRMVLRASGTEPVVRLMVESADILDINRSHDQVLEFLNNSQLAEVC